MTHNFKLPHDLLTTIRQEVRELYASVAFADMATALAVLFEPIILYKVLGLSIIQILLFMASIYAFQVVLLPLGAALGARFGYMNTMFLSVPFMVLYWLLLYSAQFDFNLLYLAPIVYGIEKAMFWPSFHATAAQYITKSGKISTKNSSNHDALYATVMVMRILGPVMGGLVGYYLGLGVVLLLAAAIYLTSLLPLLVSKEVSVPSKYDFNDTWEIYKAYPKRFVSYLGSGEEVIIMTIWPLLIFFTLGNFVLTGLVVSASAAVTTILLLSIKRVSGLESKILLVKVGSFVYTLVNLARLAVGGFYGVFIVDSLGLSSKELISLPVTTLTYERAEKTKILPYVVFYQQSGALGKCLAAVLAVVVFGLTGSLVAVFILAGAFTMLYMLV